MASSDYVLATGVAALDRLVLLDRIFGPTTRELLLDAGLDRAVHVADIGCGAGMVAVWMAERLGSRGFVTGVDVSDDQLAVARSRCARMKLQNIKFWTSSAYDTGLERETFDVVYSRFLTCHLQRPQDALVEMCALVKPGGVLICEDYDAASVASDPPTPAYERLHAIGAALDKARGVDSEIGPKLHRMFGQLPVDALRVRFRQPAFLIGPEKRFWEATLREAAPAIIESGVASQAELDDICAEMAIGADDPRQLIIVGRVCQAWAIKT